ncbi:MAG: hypothetical protein M3Q39_11780, partial [Actinomycetota bacterium]|nr:hypothetical protein [Actinomycetota bacterium]
MVVHDGHEGRGRVHGLQVGVAAIELVLGAVLGQRLHLGVAVGAGGVAARVGPLVEGALVDVVAQGDDQVEVGFLGEAGVGFVEARLVVLAGEEADAHGLARVARARGDEAPDRGVDPAGCEAVEVLLAGSQPLADAGAHHVVAHLRGAHPLGVHDVAEAGVAGDLQVQGAGALDAVDAAPQRHRPLESL